MKLAFTAKFDKQVLKITSKKLIEDIDRLIDQAEKAPSISELRNVKKLSGYKFHYRIRVGDYRIGLYLNENVLEFTAFDHRKDIYKYFP
jgi:mRNA interferase RelE/StbE